MQILTRNGNACLLSAALALSLSAAPSAVMAGSVDAAQQTSSKAKTTIEGTVFDDLGEPVIGATIAVTSEKGVGTITDMDGHFSLNVAPGTQLTITYIGLKTANVKAQPGMTVTMQSSDTQLQGVEVVAYGAQKKVTVTGAISSVKGEDLTRTSVSSVSQVLAGQMTGVSSIQYSGEPGSDAADIYLRGKATFGDGSSPLIQVDGVERSMDDVDPNEIESVTVLKDASATAVFGVRGANGVILITTKRGAEGKTRINYSSSVSLLTPTKLVEQASSYEYATFYNQMNDNDGQVHVFSDEIVEKFRTGSDPIRFASTEWEDYIMKSSTLQHQHNINISGGTNRVRYFISGGFFSQGGLFNDFGTSYDYTYDYKRFNYRTNLDIDVTKTTTLSLNVAGSKAKKAYPYNGSGGSSDLIKNMFYATPFSSPGIVDGKFVSATTEYDDLILPFTGATGMYYYGGGFNHASTDKLSVDVELKQKLDFLTKGLTFRIKGSYNSTYGSRKYGKATIATYYPVLQDDGSIKYRKEGETTNPSYSISTSKARDWYMETGLNWQRSFGLHNLSAMALYNQSKTYYPSTYSDIPRGYVGLVGRVTYNWNNRYMAEFNVGYNGSENFHPDKRFAAFPAFSAGWIASEEDFFKPLKKVVTYMKVRASWGLVGNDKIGGNRFMYTTDPYVVNGSGLIGRNGYGYNYGIDNSTSIKGAYLDTMNNPDVTWEKAFKQDYGLDVNFLDDRLRVVFDYYHEHRKNILLQDGTIPTVVGFGNKIPYTNNGEVKSWGYELSLKWHDKIGENFSYNVGANLSYNQNEIIEMREAEQENDYQYRKGHRIGARKMYKFFRFYDSETAALYEQEFGEPLPTHQVTELKDGDAVYVDLNHDGKIDSNDMSYDYGNTDDPKYTLGFNFGFKWKDLALQTQWTAAFGVSRLLTDVYRAPFYSSASKTEGGLLRYVVENSWNPENPGQGYEYPRVTMENYDNNYAESTLYEKNANYLRLKTVQLTYDFHIKALERIGISQFQLGLSGYNLLTFTPYIWGDPETRASSAPSYPLQRTYTMSLEVGF